MRAKTNPSTDKYLVTYDDAGVGPATGAAQEAGMARIHAALVDAGSRQVSDTEWSCPTHDDRSASLTVQPGDQPGGLVMACGAGCKNSDVLEALGLELKALFYRDETEKPTSSERYLYEDERGAPLFRVTRQTLANGKKKFFQDGADGHGGWRKRKGAVKGVRLVLWRLPVVGEAAVKGEEIHLSEGEKDAQALFDAGVVATCHPMGAGKWRDEYTHSLTGAASVVVWADRDAAGYRCAHQRLSSVLAAGVPARACLPIPDHKGADVFDHLAAGHTPQDGRPVTLEELEALAKQAKGEEGDAAPQTWDDFGNAQRFVDRYADRVRWVVDNEKWAVYNASSDLWTIRGAEANAGGLARKTIERMQAEEASNYDGKEGSGKGGKRSQREDWLAWVKTQRSTRAQASLLTAAKTKRQLQVRLADFDARPNLLHCANGVLDLTKLQLGPHSPESMCTLSTGTDYAPGAGDDLWSSYLDLFVPDLELRGFLRRIAGYSLLDGNPERLFLIVSGGTSTGKSTFNETALAALGGYAKPFNLSVFRANQDEKPRSDIAGILPRRYVSTVEASTEWHLHADQIKKITGGDTLAARFPFDKVDTVRTPSFVPLIFTNAVPTIEGRDRALDRRLLVLPFNREAKGRKDKRRARDEMAKSASTRSAFLSWAVEGLREYQKFGLGALPAAVVEATEGARSELSDLDCFLGQKCVVAKDARVSPQGLYDEYVDWCTTKRIHERDMLSGTKFGLAMKARGYENKRVREDGALRRRYVGLGLGLGERLHAV